MFCLPCPLHVQAALLNVLCQEGLVIKKIGTEVPVLVLAQHCWATLTWPLAMGHQTGCGEQHFSLVPDGAVQWLYCYNPEDYLVLPVKARWGDQGIFIATAGTEQPLLTYALLYLQDRFTLSNLHSVGQILGVIEPGKKPTKKKTLEALATYVGDCNFIEQVLYRAECGKQKEDHIAFEGEADMLSCLLEQLDKDEQEEYKSLKKKSTEEINYRQQEKWRQWHKEKIREKKDRSFKLSLNCGFKIC